MPNRTTTCVALALLFVAFCASCDASDDRPSGSAQATSVNQTPQPTPDKRPAARDRENEPANTDPVEVETSVIATNLEVPWGIAFLPNGDFLFTERDSGRLLRMDASGNIEEVQTLPTRGYGEGGSLGLALSPDYEEDGYVYAYYTTDQDNRVERE